MDQVAVIFHFKYRDFSCEMCHQVMSREFAYDRVSLFLEMHMCLFVQSTFFTHLELSFSSLYSLCAVTFSFET